MKLGMDICERFSCQLAVLGKMEREELNMPLRESFDVDGRRETEHTRNFRSRSHLRVNDHRKTKAFAEKLNFTVINGIPYSGDCL